MDGERNGGLTDPTLMSIILTTGLCPSCGSQKEDAHSLSGFSASRTCKRQQKALCLYRERLARNFQRRPRTCWQEARILCHVQHTNNPTQPGDTVAGREAHETRNDITEAPKDSAQWPLLTLEVKTPKISLTSLMGGLCRLRAERA